MIEKIVSKIDKNYLYYQITKKDIKLKKKILCIMVLIFLSLIILMKIIFKIQINLWIFVFFGLLLSSTIFEFILIDKDIKNKNKTVYENFKYLHPDYIRYLNMHDNSIGEIVKNYFNKDNYGIVIDITNESKEFLKIINEKRIFNYLKESKLRKIYENLNYLNNIGLYLYKEKSKYYLYINQPLLNEEQKVYIKKIYIEEFVSPFVKNNVKEFIWKEQQDEIIKDKLSNLEKKIREESLKEQMNRESSKEHKIISKKAKI